MHWIVLPFDQIFRDPVAVLVLTNPFGQYAFDIVHVIVVAFDSGGERDGVCVPPQVRVRHAVKNV